VSYIRTSTGELWGSAKQQAAVQKAAEASARKRRKRHPDPAPFDPNGPTEAEVRANPHNYRNRDAHTDAIIAARRNDRLRAGGAEIPRGKVMGADGKLRNASSQVSDILVGGKVHDIADMPVKRTRAEEIQARIDNYRRQLERPDMTGQMNATVLNNTLEGLRKNITHHQKLLAEARREEERQAERDEMAARSPERKAHDELRYARNRWEAGVRDLRKKLAELPPQSWAAQDAQRKLDGLLANEAPNPGEFTEDRAAVKVEKARVAADVGTSAEEKAEAKRLAAERKRDRVALIRKWEKIVRSKPGTDDAVSASHSIARLRDEMGTDAPKPGKATGELTTGVGKEVGLRTSSGAILPGKITGGFDTFLHVQTVDGTYFNVPRIPEKFGDPVIVAKPRKRR
jgi:hypothetical protein